MLNQMMTSRGPVPEDIQNFGGMLANLNLESTEGFFKGSVLGADGSVALIFVSDTMVRAFRNGNTFSMNSFEVSNLTFLLIIFHESLKYNLFF